MPLDAVRQKAQEILDSFDTEEIKLELAYCIVLEALGKRAVQSGNIAIMQSIRTSVANVDKRMSHAIDAVQSATPQLTNSQTHKFTN